MNRIAPWLLIIAVGLAACTSETPPESPAPTGPQTLTDGIVFEVVEAAPVGARPVTNEYIRFEAEITADGETLLSTAEVGTLMLSLERLESIAPGLARAVAASPVGEIRRWTIAPEHMQPGGFAKPVTTPATVELVVLGGADPLPAPDDLAMPPADATTTDSGLVYKRIAGDAGADAPKPGAEDIVRVHYTGWRAEDGRMFDSSVMRGTPAEFPVGRLIAGWTEGLQLMSPGETFRFWIPGPLAYDASTRPGTPKGTLVFDVELIEINPGR